MNAVDALPPSATIILKTLGDEAVDQYQTFIKNGSFLFTDVEDGRYHVAFALEDRTELGEVRFQNRLATEGTLGLSGDGNERRIEIDGVAGAARMAGVLRLAGSEAKPGIVVESPASGTSIAVLWVQTVHSWCRTFRRVSIASPAGMIYRKCRTRLPNFSRAMQIRLLP